MNPNDRYEALLLVDELGAAARTCSDADHNAKVDALVQALKVLIHGRKTPKNGFRRHSSASRTAILANKYPFGRLSVGGHLAIPTHEAILSEVRRAAVYWAGLHAKPWKFRFDLDKSGGVGRCWRIE